MLVPMILALGVLALVPGLLLLRDGRMAVRRSVIAGACLGALLLGGMGVVRDWPPALSVLAAATAAASVILLAIPAAGTSSPRSLAYALLVVGVVQAPLAFGTFDPAGLVASLGAKDFGGALVLGVPLGAAMLAWWRVRPVAPDTAPPHTRVWTAGVLGALALVAASLAAETVIDEVTPRILVSCGLSAVTGCAGWTVTRLLSGHGVKKLDPVYGMLAGLVSALASSAWVTAQWSLLIGVAAGALSAVFYGSRSRRMPPRPAALAALLLMGGAAGTVMVGLFTDGTGLVHTGGITQLGAQLGAVIVAVGWSTLMCFALAQLLKARSGPLGPSGSSGSSRQRADADRSGAGTV